MTALRSSLSGLLFLSLCCAQSTSISLTGSATLGPAPNSKYNFTGSGGGTLTPGGAVQFAIDVIGTGDDNCNDNIEAPLTITAANGDKLMLTVLVPHTSGTTFSGSFAITGGTGQYAGKGGSGTVTFEPRPEIATAKPQEDCRAAGLAPFTLEGIKNFFDAISHCEPDLDR